MSTYTEEDAKRFTRYRESMYGFWFAASLPYMKDWAENQDDLIPLAEMKEVTNKQMAEGWYAPKGAIVEDLLKYFNSHAIGMFGISDFRKYRARGNC